MPWIDIVVNCARFFENENIHTELAVALTFNSKSF